MLTLALLLLHLHVGNVCHHNNIVNKHHNLFEIDMVASQGLKKIKHSQHSRNRK